MKIVVCVKHVPSALRIDPESKRLVRSGPGELNDVDRNAVEEALRIKESGENELVVISMGPQATVESLRTVLAMGADRAVLVSDAGAEGSDLVATSKVLAAALEREAPDLVFFGQQSADGGGGLLWGAVAERLSRPFVSQVTQFELAGDHVRVTRQTEVGDDVIDVALPCFVSVSDAINEPRYTSLKGMMGAKKKPLDTVSVTDLGIAADETGEAGSKTEVISIAPPSARANTITLDDDPEAATKIFEYLVERELL